MILLSHFTIKANTCIIYYILVKDTYGTYAELRHKSAEIIKEGGAKASDIEAQKEFMDMVCRSYAARLERRRNLIITSVRFHRLIEEVNVRFLLILLYLYVQVIKFLLVLLCTWNSYPDSYSSLIIVFLYQTYWGFTDLYILLSEPQLFKLCGPV